MCIRDRDEVISEKLNPAHHIDAVESKLFGIGAESYTVGSKMCIRDRYPGVAGARKVCDRNGLSTVEFGDGNRFRTIDRKGTK